MDQDPLFEKKWTSNISKSKFSTTWKPNSETRLYEKLDNGYKLTVSGENNGKKYEWGYTAHYDDKKYPVHGREDVNGIKIYEINDKITVGFFFSDDSPGGPYARFVSEDGKRLTVQTVGRHDGQVYFDVIEYEL